MEDQIEKLARRYIEASYEARMKREVTEAEAAGHRNLLETLVPLEKTLKKLVRDYSASDVFEAKEMKLVTDFLRVLAAKAVPASSLKVKKDKRPPLLLKRPF